MLARKSEKGVIDVLAIVGLGFLVLSFIAITVTVSDPLKKQFTGALARYSPDALIRQRERAGGCKGAECLAPELQQKKDSGGTLTAQESEILNNVLEKQNPSQPDVQTPTVVQTGPDCINQCLATGKIASECGSLCAAGETETATQVIAPRVQELYREAVGGDLNALEQLDNLNPDFAQQAEDAKSLQELLAKDAIDAQNAAITATNEEDRNQALLELRLLTNQGVITPQKLEQITLQVTPPIQLQTPQQIISGKRTSGARCTFNSDCQTNYCSGTCTEAPLTSTIFRTDFETSEENCRSSANAQSLTYTYQGGVCNLESTEAQRQENIALQSELAYEMVRSPTQTYDYAICQNGSLAEKNECNIRMNLTRNVANLVTLGTFENYINAYQPDKVNLAWKAAGYSSVEACQTDLGNKYGPQGAQSCNTYQLTQDQTTSSIALGTVLTVEGALITSGVGLGTGAIAAPTALTQGFAASTVLQTGNAAVAQIEDPGSKEANIQTIYAVLSWLNLGAADSLTSSFISRVPEAINRARAYNTLVTGLNLLADVPNAGYECFFRDDVTSLGCGGSLAAVGADLFFGGLDYRQGQLSFGANPFEQLSTPRFNSLNSPTPNLDRAYNLTINDSPSNVIDTIFPKIDLFNEPFTDTVFDPVTQRYVPKSDTLGSPAALLPPTTTISNVVEEGVTSVTVGGKTISLDEFLALENAGEPLKVLTNPNSLRANADDLASQLTEPSRPTTEISNEVPRVPMSAESRAVILQEVANTLPNEGETTRSIIDKLNSSGIPEGEITGVDIAKVNELVRQRVTTQPVVEIPVAEVPLVKPVTETQISYEEITLRPGTPLSLAQLDAGSRTNYNVQGQPNLRITIDNETGKIYIYNQSRTTDITVDGYKIPPRKALELFPGKQFTVNGQKLVVSVDTKYERVSLYSVKTTEVVVPVAGSPEITGTGITSKFPVNNKNANLILDFSPDSQFRKVADFESFGGNAGEGYLAVNTQITKSGEIVSFGNIQDLPSNIRARLESGELEEIIILVKEIPEVSGPRYIIIHRNDAASPEIKEIIADLESTLNLRNPAPKLSTWQEVKNFAIDGWNRLLSNPERSGGIPQKYITQIANRVEGTKPVWLEKAQDWYAKNIQDERGFLPWLRTEKSGQVLTAKEVTSLINNTKGPIIEVAGPTPTGYRQVYIPELNRNIYVSNVETGTPIIKDGVQVGLTVRGHVDLLTDSTKLPFADNSVGTILGSKLLDHTLPQTLSEAYRTLEPEGVLVLQHTISIENGSSLGIVTQAEKFGFKQLSNIEVYRFPGKPDYVIRDLVFQKPSQTNPNANVITAPPLKLTQRITNYLSVNQSALTRASNSWDEKVAKPIGDFLFGKPIIQREPIIISESLLDDMVVKVNKVLEADIVRFNNGEAIIPGYKPEYGCHAGLCGYASDYVAMAAQERGLKVIEYQVEDLNVARGLDKKDSFGHAIAVVEDEVGNKYLIDTTFDQFVDTSTGTIRHPIRNITSSRNIQHPMVQQLLEKGYIKLDDSVINDFLKLTSAGSNQPNVGLEIFTDAINTRRTPTFSPEDVQKYIPELAASTPIETSRTQDSLIQWWQQKVIRNDSTQVGFVDRFTGELKEVGIAGIRWRGLRNTATERIQIPISRSKRSELLDIKSQATKINYSEDEQKLTQAAIDEFPDMLYPIQSLGRSPLEEVDRFISRPSLTRNKDISDEFVEKLKLALKTDLENASRDLNNYYSYLEEIPETLTGYEFRVGQRGFDTYQKLNRVDLGKIPQNATVLDIGSGLNQDFNRTLQELRPDIKPISIDPSLSLPISNNYYEPYIPKERRIIYNYIKEGNIIPTEEAIRLARRQSVLEGTVAAFMPDMPIKTEGVDLLLDSFGPAMYLDEDPDQLIRYFSESYRVLKPAGEAHIFPVTTFAEYFNRATTDAQSLRTYLENTKIRVANALESAGVPRENYVFYEELAASKIQDAPVDDIRVGLIIKKGASPTVVQGPVLTSELSAPLPPIVSDNLNNLPNIIKVDNADITQLSNNKGFFLSDGQLVLVTNSNHISISLQYGLDVNKQIAGFDSGLPIQFDGGYNIDIYGPELAKRLKQAGFSEDTLITLSGNYIGLGNGKYTGTIEEISQGLTPSKLDIDQLGYLYTHPFQKPNGESVAIGPGFRLISDTEGQFLVTNLNRSSESVNLKFETGELRQVSFPEFETMLQQPGFSVVRQPQESVFIRKIESGSQAYSLRSTLERESAIAGVIDTNGRIYTSNETNSHQLIKDSSLLTDHEVVGQFEYKPDTDTWIVSGSPDGVKNIISTLNTNGVSKVQKIKIVANFDSHVIQIDARLNSALPRLNTEIGLLNQNQIVRAIQDPILEISNDISDGVAILTTQTNPLFKLTESTGISSWDDLLNKPNATLVDIKNIENIPQMKGRTPPLQVKPVRDLYPVEIVSNLFFSQESASQGRKLVQEYISALENGGDLRTYEDIAKSYLDSQKQLYQNALRSHNSELGKRVLSNNNAASIDDIPTEDINNLVLVRVMSDPDPIGLDFEGNVVIQSSFLGDPLKNNDSLFRTSKHFTVNGPVAPVKLAQPKSDGKIIEDWSSADVIVITPMNEFVNINGSPNTFLPQDIWWTPGTYDNLILPQGTVVVIRDGSEALKQYSNLPGILIIKSQNPYTDSYRVINQLGYPYKAQGTEFSRPNTPEEKFLNADVFAYKLGSQTDTHYGGLTMLTEGKIATTLIEDEITEKLAGWADGTLLEHERQGTIIELIWKGYFSSEPINGLYISPKRLPSLDNLLIEKLNLNSLSSPLSRSELQVIDKIVKTEKITWPSYWENQGVVAQYKQTISPSTVNFLGETIEQPLDPSLGTGLPLLKPSLFGLTPQQEGLLRQNVNELTKITIPEVRVDIEGDDFIPLAKTFENELPALRRREADFQAELAGKSPEEIGRLVYGTTYTDSLTGLHNRAGFVDNLTGEVAIARQNRTTLTVITMDLKKFKVINDKLGFTKGNEALTRFGEIIKKHIRASDLASRIGGDEFTIILPRTTEEEAQKVIDRILDDLKTQKELASRNDVINRINIHVGVEEWNPNISTTDYLTRLDKEILEAKRSGSFAISPRLLFVGGGVTVVAIGDYVLENLYGIDLINFQVDFSPLQNIFNSIFSTQNPQSGPFVVPKDGANSATVLIPKPSTDLPDVVEEKPVANLLQNPIAAIQNEISSNLSSFSIFMQRDNYTIINQSGDTMANRGCGPLTAYNILNLTGHNPNLSNVLNDFYWNCEQGGCGTNADAVLSMLQQNGFEGVYDNYEANKITDANELKNYTGILVYGGTVTAPGEKIAHIAGFSCTSGNCVSIDSYFSDGKPVPCSVMDSNTLQCGDYKYYVGPTKGVQDAFYPVSTDPSL